MSIIWLLCVSDSLFAVSHDQLIEYYNNGDYSTLINRLSKEGFTGIDTRQRYLLFKALLNIGEIKSAEKVLNHLEKNAGWSLTPTILSEKLKLNGKKPDLTDFYGLIKRWPKELKSAFLIKRFKTVLTENETNKYDKPALKKVIGLLLTKFPELKEDTDILRLLLSALTPTDAKRGEVFTELWAFADAAEKDPSTIIGADLVKKNIRKHKQIILTHFNKQKYYGNHGYITKEILTYLTPLRSHDAEIFKQLSRIYFYSMTRKRQYSRLINVISSDKGRRYFRLSKAVALKMEFDLWIKKGHSQKGIAILKKLKKLDKQFDPNDMYLALADLYYSQGKYDPSIQAYRLVKVDKLSKETVEDIKWNHFLIYNKRNQRDELNKIAVWADGYQFEIPGNAAKFCYWGCKLNLYKQRDPTACYQRYPFTYYGLKALHLNNRGPQLGSMEFTSASKSKKAGITAGDQHVIAFVSMLYAIDEIDAADALIIHYLRKKNQFDLFIKLAELQVIHQRYYLLQTLGYGYYGDVLRENNAVSRALLPYFYPAGFEDQVSRLARQYKVPQKLIFAVMREESHFQPDALSRAGAVGLMQLMPKTALYVGRTIRKKVHLNMLTDPATNIQLGIAYLGRLLKRYKGNFYYTLAAYNGGATNVKRWRRKTRIDDEDYFVEKITFDETKSYVKRVMRSYYVYENLYGQNR